MAQTVATFVGNAAVTHSNAGGNTTLFTAPSGNGVRVILNGFQASCASSVQCAMTFSIFNSASSNRIVIGGVATSSSVQSFALLPGDSNGPQTGVYASASPAKFILRSQSNTNQMGNIIANDVYAECGNGAYYYYFPGNFWMAPGDTLTMRSVWGNASGNIYWSFTTITES